MARVPQHELEQLKNEASVQRLVEASGVELKKSGKDWLGRCPWHGADTNPSLVVSSAKNLWNCFGCGVGGGPIDWVIKQRGVSFRHAVELLRGDVKGDSSLAAVGGAPVGGISVKHSTVRTLAAPLTLDADDQALMTQTIDYYHQRLKESPEALAYLKARGLDHPQLVDAFKLGVADRTLGLRLPEKNRKDGAAIRERLQGIGLIRESGHEHFNGSLVVPIFDGGGPEQGHVVEVYGRKLLDNLRPGTPKHLYLPGPHAGVFNLEGVLAAGERERGERDVILCEALIDAMTFWCAGFTNVTSAYGVEGFTDNILDALKAGRDQARGIERVLIAFDRDEAGERGAEKVAERLIAEGFEVLRVVFPKGMDANEYATKMSPANRALALVLRQAEWIGSGRPPIERAEPAAEEERPEPSSLAAELVRVPPVPVPVLSMPALAPPSEHPDELHIETSACTWRIRGWKKNASPEAMRVNVQVRRKGEVPGYHIDTLDLYAARSRAAFVRQASIELALGEESVKHELGTVLFKLETLQEEWLTQTRERASATKTPILSADEEAEALELLRAPNLMDRIVTDLHSLGVVGEDMNLLAAYLAAISRKLDAPLAVLIQSSSAAGKSALMDAVLQLVPEEDRIRYSAMTGQSLFYLGETNLQHKILAIAEEEGVRQAAYALKLLQSDGELSIASTAKDEATGNLTTKQYTVKGPVMLMLTTTAIDVDDELMNRCLVLAVNESREQTAAIHVRQRHRQTLEGLLQANDREGVKTLHHNAQRLLASVAVVNPYANRLRFAADKTRTRRDHMKYLTLIQAIALLHQHQRELKEVQHGAKTLAYIEVTRADIELANRIAHDVLGRTLDELPPQTRRLLGLLRDWVHAQCTAQGLRNSERRFTRRELREAVHWGDTQLKVHLARLVDLEYVALHRQGLSVDYELVYDGADDDRAHLSGLIDVDELTDAVTPNHAYEASRSGSDAIRAASGRPSVGVWSGVGRGRVERPQSQPPCGLQPDAPMNGRKTHIEGFETSALAAVVHVGH